VISLHLLLGWHSVGARWEGETGGGDDPLNLVSKLFHFQDVGAQSERLRTRLPALPGELPVTPSAHPLTATPGRGSAVAPGRRSVATVAAIRQLRCSCLRLCKKVREESGEGGGEWGGGSGVRESLVLAKRVNRQGNPLPPPPTHIPLKLVGK
jgi:hypothetical protein